MVHQNSTNHGENFSPGQGNRKQVRSKRRRCPWRLEDIGQLRPHTSHYPPPSSIAILYSWSEQTKNPPNPKLSLGSVARAHESPWVSPRCSADTQVSNEPPEREDLLTHNAICAFLIDSDCIWHVLYIPYWSILIHIDPYWSILIHIDPYWSILIHIDPYWLLLTYSGRLGPTAMLRTVGVWEGAATLEFCQLWLEGFVSQQFEDFASICSERNSMVVWHNASN